MAQAYIVRTMEVNSLSVETEPLKVGGPRRVVDVGFVVPGEMAAIEAELKDDEYVSARNSLSLRLEETDPVLSLLSLGTHVQVMVQGVI
jgi:hypothetical protein